MSIYSRKIVRVLYSKMLYILNLPKRFWLFSYGAVKVKKRGDFPVMGLVPILGDENCEAGQIDSHYFLQDIYMAKKIIEHSPQNHYDIGSRIDGFISHLLCCGVSVTMIDIRPICCDIENLSFIQADATSLKEIPDNSLNSISTLHAIEHFGLGRYGDSIDAYACDKVMSELKRVVDRGGLLYLSLPISNKNGVLYNSHRVFTPKYIMNVFEGFNVCSFAYIRDYKIHEYVGEEAIAVIEANEFLEYDCGMFVLEKCI